jgi:hypothetical protein
MYQILRPIQGDSANIVVELSIEWYEALLDQLGSVFLFPTCSPAKRSESAEKCQQQRLDVLGVQSLLREVLHS